MSPHQVVLDTGQASITYHFHDALFRNIKIFTLFYVTFIIYHLNQGFRSVTQNSSSITSVTS